MIASIGAVATHDMERAVRFYCGLGFTVHVGVDCGAMSIGDFFAVSTECFFERPAAI